MYALEQTPVDFGVKDWFKTIGSNFEKLMAEDARARKAKTLLGRVIAHGWADGAAYYQIIKVNKKTVRIRVCENIGDDWVLPAWGPETTLPIEKAKWFLR